MEIRLVRMEDHMFFYVCMYVCVCVCVYMCMYVCVCVFYIDHFYFMSEIISSCFKNLQECLLLYFNCLCIKFRLLSNIFFTSNLVNVYLERERERERQVNETLLADGG